MASESIKILIEAEDKASMQVAAASKNIEQAVKGVKETGQKAKGSLEFVGVLAGQLGGAELQTAAQGMGAITEKVGQFSEVMKAGGAAAGVFQAGIMALVATMSFSLGKTIGETIFGVRDLSKELEDMTAQFEAQGEAMRQAASAKLGEQMEDLQLIRDPKKQQKEAFELFNAIQKKRDEAIRSAGLYENQVESIRQTENKYLGKLGELSEADNERANQLQLTANNQRALAAEYDNELAKLGQVYGQRAKSIQAIKEQQRAEDEAAAKKKSLYDTELSSLRGINYQYIELTKGQDAARRAQLQDQGLSQIQIDRIRFAEDALKVEKDLAAQKQKAQDAELSRLQKVGDLAKNELDRLKEQKIALEQGEQAAHAFRLTQQGLDQETANAIAASQAAMDTANKAAQQRMQPVPQNMATESRLLARGPREDSQKKIEQYTKATSEQTAATAIAIEKLSKVIEATEKETLVIQKRGI